VGEGVARKLDFQLISATHQPLDHLVQEQRFRSDLLFRLNGLQLWLPPLRERSRLDALIDVVLNEQGLAPEHLSPACRKVLETFAW
ncbi:sigma-54-dependent Fis family transcriptional regulator, partial [Herbaspirillum sp. RU 5E]|nr:sigma-54-dependent Fis family transcriptional regulator [Herbaspirillum sp. RU 5E]